MTHSELIKRNGASSSEKALEQRARRMAARRGIHITKLRSSSHFADQYGPCMTSDDRNVVRHYGIPTIEQVIDILAQEETR
jgi:hypothetical protein